MGERATVANLATHFGHSPEFLAGLGVKDGPNGVSIDYGPGTRGRLRLSLNGDRRFVWVPGQEPIVPYGPGLEGVPDPREAGMLLVVEGESDCWALWAWDFPAVGLPGCEMADKLEVEHIAGVRRLFVVKEPDDSGASFVTKVGRRVATLLGDSRPEMYVLVMGERIEDPAELLATCAGDPDEFAARLWERIEAAEPLEPEDEAEPEQAPTLVVRSVADSMRNPPSPLNPLVGRLILPGDRVVIGGARGTAKSWAAMGLALQLARGTGQVLGRFPVEQAVRVLFAHGELPDDESTQRRWATLASGGEVPEGLLETFGRWRIVPVRRRETFGDRGGSYSTEWHDAEIHGGLSEALETWRPEVLVLDPWAAYYLGQENSNNETEAALAALDDATRDLGVTLVLVHHFRQDRAGVDPEDVWRGASRLPDWASVRITLSPVWTGKQAKSQGMTRVQARGFARVQMLLRRQETPDDFGIKWNPETGWWEPWTLPGGEATAKLDNITVLAALREAGGEWASTRQAADNLGVVSETVKPMLERLAAEGKIKATRGARNATGWRLP